MFDPQVYTDFGAALSNLESRISDEFAAQAALIAALPAPRITRTARVSGPAMSASTTADITVTWATPFADTNYTVAVNVQENLSTVANGVIVRQIRSKTADGIVVRVSNGSQVFAAGDITLHATATHD